MELAVLSARVHVGRQVPEERGVEATAYDDPTALKAAISSQGLIVPVAQIAFADVVELVALHRDAGESRVIERVREHYDDVFSRHGFLDELEASWAKDPLLKRRVPVLHQALQAHRLGMFAVSTPTLIAQFEGLVADAVSHTGRMCEADLRGYLSSVDLDITSMRIAGGCGESDVFVGSSQVSVPESVCAAGLDAGLDLDAPSDTAADAVADAGAGG